PYQFINRAEAASRAERSGPLFLDENRQIFPPWYICVFRISLDLCKVTQVLQTLLRGVYANRVENISRGDKHFATDDLILGARVALNIHPIHKRACALFDRVVHVYERWPGRLVLGRNLAIDVAS